MASETDLLNDSLSQIGVNPITAIDDGSIPANHCQRLYPALRDSVLRAHHWNFATKRVQLALEVASPVYGYTYQYALPSDCLKVVSYSGASPANTTLVTDEDWIAPWQYRIEGRKLLSNDAEAWITYLSRITNPDEWDSLFYQTIAAWLASKLATAINHDFKMGLSKLEEATRVLLPLAMASDGQEGSVEAKTVDDLLRVR